MDWIKRNLYFLIGSLVALALMGLAGWYLYSKWQLNNEILGKLDEQYAKLKRLNHRTPIRVPARWITSRPPKSSRRSCAPSSRKPASIFQALPPHPRAGIGQVDQPGIQLRPEPNH